MLICLSAKTQSKTPAYFIDKIPPYPASAVQYKQTHKALEALIVEANAEIMNYAEVAEASIPEGGSDVVTRRVTLKYAAKAQKQKMEQLKEAEEITEVLTKTEQYKMDFENLQSEYKKEVIEKVAPIDAKLSTFIRDRTEKTNPALVKVKKERAAAYEPIMKKYLSGPAAKFASFLNEFLSYTKTSIIPFSDRREAAKYSSLKLNFTPHAESLEAVKNYMMMQLRAEDSYRDLREY